MNWNGGTRNRLHQGPKRNYNDNQFRRGYGHMPRRDFQARAATAVGLGQGHGHGFGQIEEERIPNQSLGKRPSPLLDFLRGNMPFGDLLALQLSHQMEIDKGPRGGVREDEDDEENDPFDDSLPMDVVESDVDVESGSSSIGTIRPRSEFEDPGIYQVTRTGGTMDSDNLSDNSSPTYSPLPSDAEDDGGEKSVTKSYTFTNRTGGAASSVYFTPMASPSNSIIDDHNTTPPSTPSRILNPNPMSTPRSLLLPETPIPHRTPLQNPMSTPRGQLLLPETPIPLRTPLPRHLDRTPEGSMIQSQRGLTPQAQAEWSQYRESPSTGF